MSQLFVKAEDGEWALLRLEESGFLLTSDPPCRIADPKKIASIRSQVLLTLGPGGRWLLTWGADRDVRIQGLPQRLGLRVLEHRDEIRVEGAGTIWFSSEKRPEIVPFPGAEDPVYCARCKTPMDEGDPAVRCPGCDLWYHEKKDRNCWTYSDKCVFCGHLTALDAELAWTPTGV